MTRRRALFGAAGLVVVFLLAVAVVGNGRPAPLDPRSIEDDGARALVRLLEGTAGSVELADRVPGPEVDVAVLLVDGLSAPAAEQLGGWVADGGRLVVADPRSPFLVDAVPAASPLPSGCEIPALGSVAEVVTPAPSLFDIARGDRSCFAADGAGFVYVADAGSSGGAVIGVGDPFVWSNAFLAEGDNAMLAVALVAPDRTTSVAVLAPAPGLNGDLDPPTPVDTPTETRPEDRSEVGAGSDGVFGLMPGYLRWIVLNLALAWLVYAIARGHRLGRPVPESVPVELAGSELVRARGRLLRKTGPSATVVPLQRATRHELADEIGLPRAVDAEILVRAICERTDLDAAGVHGALYAPAPLDDAAIVELTHNLDHIRQEVLREQRHPTPR